MEVQNASTGGAIYWQFGEKVEHAINATESNVLPKPAVLVVDADGNADVTLASGQRVTLSQKELERFVYQVIKVWPAATTIPHGNIKLYR